MSMPETLTGATYTWTAAGAGGNKVLGNGLAALTWSPAIPMTGGDELGVIINVTGVTSVLMRMRFGAEGGGGTIVWAQEQVELQPTTVAGAQRYAINPKEWGPLAAAVAPGVFYLIERPSTFHFVGVGFYGTGAPAGGDSVQIWVDRQSGGQLGVGQL